jgi:hypothetical protein
MSILGRDRPLESPPLAGLGSSDADAAGDATPAGDAHAPARSSPRGSPGFGSPPGGRPAAQRLLPKHGAAAAAVPPSPLSKVLDMMMEPPSPGLVLQPAAAASSGGEAPRTPTAAPAATPARMSSVRRGVRATQEPPTPEERVIQLMLRGEAGEGADGAWDGRDRRAYGGGEVRGCGDGGSDDDADNGDDGGSSSGAGSSSDSGDEIAVEDLEALCAAAAAQGAGGSVPDMSPIAEIIGLVLATPAGRGALTASAARKAAGAPGARAEEEDSGAGPRVLFTDD